MRPHFLKKTVFSTPSPSRVFEVVPPQKTVLAYIDANNYLARSGSNIASQGGEDGVIQKILETLGFTAPGWCVEFGACDGKRDSNTWNLVKNHQWKAVYIEPEPKFFKRLKQHCDETPNTWCFNCFVGTEGENRLDAILARTPIPKEPEFMVIDIDGPDYYVWEAMEDYQPHILCVEFHRLINPSVFYVPEKEAFASRPSSIRALCEMGKRKGYELVCVINWNLFFVRKEHFAKFNIKDNRPESMYYPHEEMRILQGYDGTLFLGGNDKHYWKYQRDEKGMVTNITITHNDIQVLPEGLRIFRPRHTYRSETLEKQAGKLDAGKVPGNLLLQHRRNVASENGEDGILEHIFETIGASHRICVDVGACDGKKWSNSWNLIAGKGWKGLLIEAEEAAFNQLSTVTYHKKSGVQCIRARIDSHVNLLEEVMKKHHIPKSFDLLCIDVEGNDYHIFSSLKTYSPAVVVIDFNPSVENDIVFIQEDDERAHYGSSLLALTRLANEKKYELAAVTDWNAIFVRRDLFMKLGITDNQINNMYIPPFAVRMFQTLDGCTHLAGCKTLMRQDYEIAWEDFQVLPQKLRGRDDSFENFGNMKTTFYS